MPERPGGVILLSYWKKLCSVAASFLICLSPAFSQSVSGGGLELDFSDSGKITRVGVDGRDLPVGSEADGFYLRDLRGANQSLSPLFEEGFEGAEFHWEVRVGDRKIDVELTGSGAHEGAKSLLVAVQQAEAQQQCWILSPKAAEIPVIPGKRYRLQSVYKALRGYLSVNAGTFKRQRSLYEPGKGAAHNGIGLLWLDGYGRALGECQLMAPFFDQALDWKAAGGFITAPEGASYARVVISANLNPIYDQEGFLVDAVRFFECPSRLEPFSGFVLPNDRGIEFSGFSGPFEVRAVWTGRNDSIEVSGWVKASDGLPHAFDLHVSIPVNAEGWVWPDDTVSGRKIQTGEDYRYANSVSADSQSNLPVSLYPYGGVFDNKSGVAAAVPLQPIRLVDIGYDVRRNCLDLCFRLGIDPTRKPGRQAAFSARLYSFEAMQGFRGVIDGYRRAWAEKKDWFSSPFDPALYREMRHYDFSGKPGAKRSFLCDVHDVLGLEYTVPDFVVENVAHKGSTPPTLTEMLDVIEERKNSADPEERAYYMMLAGTIKRASNGDPVLKFCKEVKWSKDWLWAEFKIDPSAGGYNDYIADHVLAPAFHDTMYPNPKWKVAPSIIDGVFLDNLLMQSAIDFNGERAQTVCDHALTYSPNDYCVGLPPAAGLVEHLEWLRQWLDTNAPDPNRWIMVNIWGLANSNACIPWIDVYGDEVQHVIESGVYGRGRTVNFSPKTLRYKRALAFNKYRGQAFEGDGITEENVLDILHTCLLHGTGARPAKRVAWENPAVFGESECLALTDRHNEQVVQLYNGGWEPLTYVSTDVPDLYLERYGSPEEGSFFVVVLNDGAGTVSGNVVLSEKLGLTEMPEVFEEHSGLSCAVRMNGSSNWTVDFSNLPSRRSLLFQIVPAGGQRKNSGFNPGPGMFGGAGKSKADDRKKPGSSKKSAAKKKPRKRSGKKASTSRKRSASKGGLKTR